jgi:glycosyltransferase involved in cell wall biosynthesis
MRVLAANKYYFVKGGAERYYFELADILRSRGHEVVPFAMQHERNDPSEHADLFVSHEAFDGGAGPLTQLRAAARVVYSVEARRKIETLVERVRPDVAHLHNIAHQLSPSILWGLRARGVPVVQTLHDYKLVCPNYQMFVHGETCERCRSWRYWNAVVHRCMRDSLARSATVCVEAYAHRILRTYEQGVSLFIAPSRSLRDRMIAHGVAAEKIVHLPYAIGLSAYQPAYAPGGYVMFVGRLAAGKGVETLLRAAARARSVRFRIVGSGPLGPALQTTAANERLDNVEFLGHLSGRDLARAFQGALSVVVPSECYENSPLAIYETFAYGKPVVGSSIGGIPELVVEGETGRLFEPGDAAGLAEALVRLWDDPAKAADMGRAARLRVEREFGPERHYEEIVRIYERVIQ